MGRIPGLAGNSLMSNETVFNGVHFSGGTEEKVTSLSRLMARRSGPGPVITIRTHRGPGDTVPMIINLILAANTTNTSLPEKVGAEVLTIRVYSHFPSDIKYTCE